MKRMRGYSNLGGRGTAMDEAARDARLRALAERLTPQGRARLRLGEDCARALRRALREVSAMDVAGDDALNRLRSDAGRVEACLQQARAESGAKTVASEDKPRVLLLARELIDGGERLLTKELLLRELALFDAARSLEMRELQLIPAALRIALCEALADVAVDVLRVARSRAAADEWVRAGGKGKMRGDCDEAFFERALQLSLEQEQPELHARVERAIERCGQRRDWLVERAHRIAADCCLRLDNLMRLKHLLDGLNWRRCFEALSPAEQELRGDPSGLYPRMDADSRARVRQQVESLARHAKTEEIVVVRHALRLAHAAMEQRNPKIASATAEQRDSDDLRAAKKACAEEDLRAAKEARAAKNAHGAEFAEELAPADVRKEDLESSTNCACASKAESSAENVRAATVEQDSSKNRAGIVEPAMDVAQGMEFAEELAPVDMRADDLELNEDCARTAMERRTRENSRANQAKEIAETAEESGTTLSSAVKQEECNGANVPCVAKSADCPNSSETSTEGAESSEITENRSANDLRAETDEETVEPAESVCSDTSHSTNSARSMDSAFSRKADIGSVSLRAAETGEDADLVSLRAAETGNDADLASSRAAEKGDGTDLASSRAAESVDDVDSASSRAAEPGDAAGLAFSRAAETGDDTDSASSRASESEYDADLTFSRAAETGDDAKSASSYMAGAAADIGSAFPCMSRSIGLASDDPRASVCWYLVEDEGRAALCREMGVRAPRRMLIDPSGRRSVALVCALTVAALALILWGVGEPWLMVFGLPLAWGCAWRVLGRFYPKFVRPGKLLKLKLESVPEDARTLVALPVLLSGEARAREMVARMEALGCLERDPNVDFLLLGDFRDGDAPHEPEDEAILRAARAGVARLNAEAGREKYHYLHRARKLREIDNRWMGENRKRGALMALNRLLLGREGAETAFEAEGACAEQLAGRYRYVITLDADTEYLPGTVQKLVGTMLHPFNRCREAGVDGWNSAAPGVEGRNQPGSNRKFDGEGAKGDKPEGTAFHSRNRCQAVAEDDLSCATSGEDGASQSCAASGVDGRNQRDFNHKFDGEGAKGDEPEGMAPHLLNRCRETGEDGRSCAAAEADDTFQGSVVTDADGENRSDFNREIDVKTMKGENSEGTASHLLNRCREAGEDGRSRAASEADGAFQGSAAPNADGTCRGDSALNVGDGRTVKGIHAHWNGRAERDALEGEKFVGGKPVGAGANVEAIFDGQSAGAKANAGKSADMEAAAEWIFDGQSANAEASGGHILGGQAVSAKAAAGKSFGGQSAGAEVAAEKSFGGQSAGVEATARKSFNGQSAGAEAAVGKSFGGQSAGVEAAVGKSFGGQFEDAEADAGKAATEWRMGEEFKNEEADARKVSAGKFAGGESEKERAAENSARQDEWESRLRNRSDNRSCKRAPDHSGSSPHDCSDEHSRNYSRDCSSNHSGSCPRDCSDEHSRNHSSNYSGNRSCNRARDLSHKNARNYSCNRSRNRSRTSAPLRRGYAVLQPDMALTAEASLSAYVELTAGRGGVDGYPTSVSDFYQDMTGRGCFAGKGIYDVRAFAEATEGALDDDGILSHDMIEGVLAGAGVVNDVHFYDGCPERLGAELQRLHRWTRGDWQLLPVLCSKLRLGAVDRMKIVGNLLRSLHAPALLGLLLLAIWLDVPGAFALGLVLAFLEPVLNLPFSLFGEGRRSWRAALLRLATLPATAFCQLDAILRTLWRLAVSRKHLMDWVTAADASGSDARTKLPGRIAALLALPGMLRGQWIVPALGIAMLFWVGAGWADDLSRQRAGERAPLKSGQNALLMELARRTWHFFETYVPQDGPGLPPDNVQLDPDLGPALRTSPTNVGLYLMSCLAARELGLLSDKDMRARMAATVGTLEGLEKWNGLLYNWYDIETLAPLRPRYVSAVDSGNLAGALLLCAHALRESDPALSKRLRALAEGMDLAALYDEERDLFRIGMDVEGGRLSESHYDLYASEARILSFAAMMLGQAPVKHWARLNRASVRVGNKSALLSWSGTMFEYLMPELMLRSPANSLAGRSREGVAAWQIRHGKRNHRPWGVSESGYYAFDGQLNYQYRAFGLPELALSGDAEAGVIAPYAAALALCCDPAAATENLRQMCAQGWSDEFGLYEAADYVRAGDGEGAPTAHSDGGERPQAAHSDDGERPQAAFVARSASADNARADKGKRRQAATFARPASTGYARSDDGEQADSGERTQAATRTRSASTDRARSGNGKRLQAAILARSVTNDFVRSDNGERPQSTTPARPMTSSHARSDNDECTQAATFARPASGDPASSDKGTRLQTATLARPATLSRPTTSSHARSDNDERTQAATLAHPTSADCAHSDNSVQPQAATLARPASADHACSDNGERMQVSTQAHLASTGHAYSDNCEQMWAATQVTTPARLTSTGHARSDDDERFPAATPARPASDEQARSDNAKRSNGDERTHPATLARSGSADFARSDYSEWPQSVTPAHPTSADCARSDNSEQPQTAPQARSVSVDYARSNDVEQTPAAAQAHSASTNHAHLDDKEQTQAANLTRPEADGDARSDNDERTQAATFARPASGDPASSGKGVRPQAATQARLATADFESSGKGARTQSAALSRQTTSDHARSDNDERTQAAASARPTSGDPACSGKGTRPQAATETRPATADFARSDDGEPRIVRSHMAHHQGMVLCAICNALRGDALAKMFLDIPEARALRLLLQEKPGPLPPRRGHSRPEPRAEHHPEASYSRGGRRNVAVDAHLLRGANTTALITARGATFVWSDGLQLTRFSGDLTNPHEGLFVHLEDATSGACTVLGTNSTRAAFGKDNRASSDAGMTRFSKAPDGMQDEASDARAVFEKNSKVGFDANQELIQGKSEGAQGTSSSVRTAFGEGGNSGFNENLACDREEPDEAQNASSKTGAVFGKGSRASFREESNRAQDAANDVCSAFGRGSRARIHEESEGARGASSDTRATFEKGGKADFDAYQAREQEEFDGSQGAAISARMEVEKGDRANSDAEQIHFQEESDEMHGTASETRAVFGESSARATFGKKGQANFDAEQTHFQEDSDAMQGAASETRAAFGKSSARAAFGKNGKVGFDAGTERFQEEPDGMQGAASGTRTVFGKSSARATFGKNGRVGFDAERVCFWEEFAETRGAASGARAVFGKNSVSAVFGKHGRVSFDAGLVRFREEFEGIEAELRLCVSPEDGALYQIVELENPGDEARELIVSGCMAVALAPERDMRAHPTFQNLFVEGERLTPRALLLRRRPRTTGQALPGLIYLVSGGESPRGELRLDHLLARTGSLGEPGGLNWECLHEEGQQDAAIKDIARDAGFRDKADETCLSAAAGHQVDSHFQPSRLNWERAIEKTRGNTQVDGVSQGEPQNSECEHSSGGRALLNPCAALRVRVNLAPKSKARLHFALLLVPEEEARQMMSVDTDVQAHEPTPAKAWRGERTAQMTPKCAQKVAELCDANAQQAGNAESAQPENVATVFPSSWEGARGEQTAHAIPACEREDSALHNAESERATLRDANAEQAEQAGHAERERSEEDARESLFTEESARGEQAAHAVPACDREVPRPRNAEGRRTVLCDADAERPGCAWRRSENLGCEQSLPLRGRAARAMEEDAADRALRLASAQARTVLMHAGVDGARFALYQRAAALLFDPKLRPGVNGGMEAGEPVDRRELWSAGVSGELPILLVELNGDDLSCAREGVRLHAFYRSMGVASDFVLVDCREGGYRRNPGGELGGLIAASHLGGMLDIPGGAHIRERDGLSAATLDALRRAAALRLRSEGAPLAQLRSALDGLKLRGGEAYRPMPAVKLPPPSDLQYFNGFGGFRMSEPSKGGPERRAREADDMQVEIARDLGEPVGSNEKAGVSSRFATACESSEDEPERCAREEQDGRAEIARDLDVPGGINEGSSVN